MRTRRGASAHREEKRRTPMNALRITRCLLVVVAVSLLCAGPSSADHISAKAVASITSCDPATSVEGLLVLTERASTEGIKVVDVLLGIRGLAPGKHAVHVHAVA